MLPARVKATAANDDPSTLTSRVWITINRTRGGRFARDTFKGFRALIHGFRGERISLRAAALTYVSIFSLMSLMTVALVLVQPLHQKQFQQRLLIFIHDVFAPGIREELPELFGRFIERAHSVTAGSIGFVTLLVSAGTLLKNLDASLNEIWSVRRKRPWHLRIVYYVAILLLGPVLLTISLVGTGLLRTVMEAAHVPHWREVFALGAWIAAVGSFSAVYYVAPNAPVRFRSALSGGIIAGSAWELARKGYAEFGARIFQYDPIFGSLGEAPLFLAWIYLSWLLVLFGARLAYAVEYASFQGTYRALGTHPRAKELVAAQAAQVITLAHLRGALAPNPRDLARALEVPEDTVRDISESLELAGLVVTGRGGGLHPARDPDELTVAELSAAVGGVISLLTSDSLSGEMPRQFRHLETLFAQIDRATVARLGKVTWSSLIGPELKSSLTEAAKPRKRAARNP